MALKAASAFSTNTDAYHAGFEAVSTALKRAGIETPSLAIVFASVSYDQAQVVKGARDAANHAPLVGCSTAGEITQGEVSTKSVAALVLESPDMKITTGRGAPLKEGAAASGTELAKALKEAAPGPLKLIVALSDVLSGNGAEVVRGIQAEMGEKFLIVGGGAGDDFLFKSTYQYLNDEVLEGSSVGIGLGGEFSIGVGVRHGWMPIGIPMIATRSSGSVLYELDHRPAIAIYEEYFGTHAAEMRTEPLARMAITYPIGLRITDMDEYLIRDPITVGDDGSITCAAEIPEGAEVRLMIGSRDKAIEAAQEAAQKLMNDFTAQKSQPKAIFVFNCIAREKLFGLKAKEEIQAVQEIVGADVPLIGFYTYGEIAPVGGEVNKPDKVFARFYNETLVLFGIGE